MCVSEDCLKNKLVDTMRFLVQTLLTNPRGGNGSIRVKEHVWITPSGIPKHELKPSDLVLYDLRLKTFIGLYKPSIEYKIHIMVYERIDCANAVLHAHLPLATSLASIHGVEWVKHTFSEIEYSVGKIGLAREAPAGTEELARNVLDMFVKGMKTVVVPRHGVFVWGKSIGEALDALVGLENAAKYYITSRIIGKLL